MTFLQPGPSFRACVASGDGSDCPKKLAKTPEKDALSPGFLPRKHEHPWTARDDDRLSRDYEIVSSLLPHILPPKILDALRSGQEYPTYLLRWKDSRILDPDMRLWHERWFNR